ncbi:MAG: hypothetical protein R2697_12650 [Ilumatobacteraceae bacterium]
MSDDDAARRSRLNGVKLRALVRDHLAADEVPEPIDFPPGAALLVDDAAWVLIDDQPATRLGAAVLWAMRNGAGHVHVVAEQGTGQLARRAAEFSMPIEVWHADGRVLLPAVVEPLAAATELPGHHESFRQLIVDGGAEPSVEHGVLVGEVRGLEVCRVVDDPHTGTTRLEVGVGAHDREAFQMLHGDVPAADSLARIVDAVAPHRQVGAAPHPLNRLGAERFVRWRGVDDPSIVGLDTAVSVAPPVPRANLKDPVPCVALGERGSDRLVVVCSSGVDLDLVPFAADAALAHDLPVMLVLPERDRVRAVDELATTLRHPTTIVTI